MRFANVDAGVWSVLGISPTLRTALNYSTVNFIVTIRLNRMQVSVGRGSVLHLFYCVVCDVSLPGSKTL